LWLFVVGPVPTIGSDSVPTDQISRAPVPNVDHHRGFVAPGSAQAGQGQGNTLARHHWLLPTVTWVAVITSEGSGAVRKSWLELNCKHDDLLLLVKKISPSM